MNEVQVFKSPSFGQIRTAGTPDKPLFCLSDVCEALGLTAKGVKQRLGDEVISNYPVYDSLGRQQVMLFVNEDGLYDVIFDSRKQEAKAFRKWVTSEVLPSIRKTGSYSSNNLPQTYKQALQQLLLQVEQNEQLQLQNQQQQEQITIMLPKARIYDDVIQSPDDEWLNTTSAVANEIGMSAQKLNKMLVACDIIYKARNGDYLFTSDYLKWNLGKSISVVVNEKKGHIRTYIKWNTRGRAYIHALRDTDWNKRRAWHLLKYGKEAELS